MKAQVCHALPLDLMTQSDKPGIGMVGMGRKQWDGESGK
ncbi:MAG: hypothetical protein K0R47_2941 [Brevibacillus sp.]|nr:hypothetical protein [Brevibacillus sp.]